MNDDDAWKRYPQHRLWFNKLWLSDRLGYECGPSGLAPETTKYYVVRPIYNLSGMGIGAEYVYIEAGDASKVPPGYFWQELFRGEHYSATFVYEKGWRTKTCYQGFRDTNDLWRFCRWRRSSKKLMLPGMFEELRDVERINVEFKGNKIIEVHLRDTPDPHYDEFVPVWEDTTQEMLDKYIEMGYTYKNNYDDADGFLGTPRLGFFVRNDKE